MDVLVGVEIAPLYDRLPLASCLWLPVYVSLVPSRSNCLGGEIALSELTYAFSFSPILEQGAAKTLSGFSFHSFVQPLLVGSIMVSRTSVPFTFDSH